MSGKRNFEVLFEKADWLNGIKSFDSAFSNIENNVHVESPLPLFESFDSEEIFRVVNGLKNVLIGRNSYKMPTGIVSPNIIIGRYCSIAHYTNLGSTNHHMDYLSTGLLNSPFYGAEEIEEAPYTIIGCDVWIGINATVIGGSKIGHGASIGAGAVVTKEIPPYAIAVGVPARVIKSRFSDEVISDLLDLEWWKLKPEIINTLPYKNIKDCISKLKEIRKEDRM